MLSQLPLTFVVGYSRWFIDGCGQIQTADHSFCSELTHFDSESLESNGYFRRVLAISGSGR